MNSNGSALVELEVGAVARQHECVIADVTEPLPGVNFMKKYKCGIRCTENGEWML